MQRKSVLVVISVAAMFLAACATPPAPVEPSSSGTWIGPLPIGAAGTRIFTVQLHERADQTLIGYVLGGTSYQTVVGGFRSGDRIFLIFGFDGTGLTRVFFLNGALSGDTLSGTAGDGSVSGAAMWTRSPGSYEERKFVFFDSASGGEDLTELAVVLDGSGVLVSGGFAGAGCNLIECGGGVTSFSETAAGALTIGVETAGACSGTGIISATFDAATKFYSGSWRHTDDGGCGGATTGGALVGGRDMGTQSDHAASVIASLGTLADDLEAGASFAAPYAPVSGSYRHFGETTAQFLAARNAEVAAHSGIQIEFGMVKSLRTVVPLGLNPFLSATPIVAFHDRRSDASGTYRDVAAQTPGEGAFNYIGDDGAGAWRLTGNQVGAFDLPFVYTPAAKRLLVPVGSGATAGTLHLSLGGWGAHFGPLTGHLEGNGKTDMLAQYAGSPADLTELANGAGGTPGSCDIDLVWSGSGELCGFFGGLTGDIIRDRIFRYIAPYDGEVREIRYEERPRPASAPETHYFDNVPHWSVRIAFEGGVTIRFDHLGQITGAVRSGLIAATGVDPDTYVPSSTPGDPDYCPPSPGRCEVNVLSGSSFMISAGDEIAKAQTDAAPIPGHPGYYRGQIGPSIPPWGQVEFFMSEEVGSAGGADVCVYQYLPVARQATLAALMTADMTDPQSLRYAENGFVRPWKFRAEAELCNNGGYFIRNENDFSSIHSQLGGWYERAESGTTANEQFTIAKIHKTAGAYDPGFYDFKPGTTEKTDYLIARARTDSMPFTWVIPGVGPTAIYYPAGEALELTSSSFVVKWRELGGLPGTTLYQSAAYELDVTSGLKVKWGGLSSTLAGAALPTLAPGEICNDVDVLCFGHQRH